MISLLTYVAFAATLIFAYLLLQIPAIGSRFQAGAVRFAKYLETRGAFDSNLSVEMPKFALLRMVFGGILVARAAYILFFLFPADLQNTPLVAFAFLNLIASLLVLIGFLSQFAFAYLFAVHWQIADRILGTGTLGNYLAATLVIFFLFANAGAHLSVDSRLRKSDSWLGNVIRLTYYPHGMPPWQTVQLSKFFALFSYWCVCVYSFMMHLGEVAWTTGVAAPQLLTNSFMSRYHSEFIEVFENFPFTIEISKVLLWLQMMWFSLLLPMVLWGGVPKRLAMIWGLLFFVLSTFFLRLGWLGEFEFILWSVLFWTKSFLDNQRSFALCYDDRCNLCDRTVMILRYLDIFNQLELKPVSENRLWLQSIGLSSEKALVDLYGIAHDRRGDRLIFSGYDLYIELSKRLFLCLPLFVFLRIGKVGGVGPGVYRWIADRRTKLFGVCRIPTTKPEYTYLASSDAHLAAHVRTPIAPVLHLHMIILGAAHFAVMPVQLVGWNGMPFPEHYRAAADILARASQLYGIGPIDVFNHTDLKMAENWFSIEATFHDGKRTLLPILAEDGSRLGWHRSDRIYFGHTLIWRRSHIGRTGCFFGEDPMMRNFMELFERTTGSIPKEYVYRQFRQQLPSAEKLSAGVYLRQPSELVCEIHVLR